MQEPHVCTQNKTEIDLRAKQEPQVKNKSWFGILNVLVLMLGDWAILRESAIAIMEESKGSDACINSSYMFVSY